MAERFLGFRDFCRGITLQGILSMNEPPPVTVGGGNTPIGIVCHKTLKKKKKSRSKDA